MNQKNNLIAFILILLNLNFISSQLLNNNELQISNCFTASEVSGCLNVDCQKKVCKIDNYCCIMNWDQLCVRNANYYCNKANKKLTRNDLTPIMNEIIYNNSLNNPLNETLNNNEIQLNIVKDVLIPELNKTDELNKTEELNNNSNSLNEDFKIEQNEIEKNKINENDNNNQNKNNKSNTSKAVINNVSLILSSIMMIILFNN